MRTQLQRLFEAFTLRLFVSHVLVAILTSVIVTLLSFGAIWHLTKNPPLIAYQTTAINYGAMWLFGYPDGEPNDYELIDPMPGWTLILSPENTVVWARGDTTCRAGMSAADCTPEALTIEEGERFFDHDGEQWAEVAMPLITGDRIIMQRGEVLAEPFIMYGDTLIHGYDALLLYEILTRWLVVLPIALLLAWLFTRRVVRRLTAVTQASKKFAQGDLQARIGDSHQDDVGRLAQQFDDMAGALAQNIDTLQTLAQRNAALAQEAEQAAIKAERMRISRDIHDAIAQRLFSLSVSTTTLPELIAQDRDKGISQAKTIAELAEQTLLDLRTLLVELRPTNIVQHGLAESLKVMLRQWQTLHQIEVESELMLTGKRIPTAVEDALYRIVQEALSNVAHHAQATLVNLSLVEGQQQLVLSISDNGCGFDVDQKPQSAKFGLMSMRERAQMFGGKLAVESEMGRGTTIQVTLPLAINGRGTA